MANDETQEEAVAPETPRLAGRVVLVTGASRGLGYHTALAAAAEGAHVIALARTVGGLEQLDDDIRKAGGEPATLVPLDLLDHDAIDRLGASIDQRWGRLDGFVANAAMLGGLSPLGHYDLKVFERIFEVNVTANWRCIRSFDPLLRASDAGRALFVTCAAARENKAFWGPYAASKAALESLALVYAAESASTAIKANLIDPGVARTALRAQAMPGEEAWAQRPPQEIAPTMIDFLLPDLTHNGRLYCVERKKFLPRRQA